MGRGATVPHHLRRVVTVHAGQARCKMDIGLHGGGPIFALQDSPGAHGRNKTLPPARIGEGDSARARMAGGAVFGGRGA